MLNGVKAACSQSGVYLAYPAGASQPCGVAARAGDDDPPRRVGPGETFSLEVRLTNRDSADRVGLPLRLVLPADWKAKPGPMEIDLGARASAAVKFAVDVPNSAAVGSTHEVKLALGGAGGEDAAVLPLGRVAIVPPLAVRFDEESIRMAAQAKRVVGLTVTNPTGSPVRGRVRLAGLAQARVEPAEIEVPPIPPGAKHTCPLTLHGGSRGVLGEIKAQVVAAEIVGEAGAVPLPVESTVRATASLQASVGVTRSEDTRHKLPFPQADDDRAYHPVWVVRAPAYEMWFSQRHGLGRTLLDSSSHSVYAWAWGSIGGLCEFWREVGGPGDYRCIFGGDPDCRPNRMTWHDNTLECESPHGDRITIACTEQHVHWRVRAPAEKVFPRGFGMRLHGLFGHPSFSAIHSDRERPAQWPATVGELAYCCIRQPGFSPDCIWIAATGVVPRCTMTDRGISVEWHGLARPALDMYLGIAPETDVVRRIRQAADGK